MSHVSTLLLCSVYLHCILIRHCFILSGNSAVKLLLWLTTNNWRGTRAEGGIMHTVRSTTVHLLTSPSSTGRHPVYVCMHFTYYKLVHTMCKLNLNLKGTVLPLTRNNTKCLNVAKKSRRLVLCQIILSIQTTNKIKVPQQAQYLRVVCCHETTEA